MSCSCEKVQIDNHYNGSVSGLRAHYVIGSRPCGCESAAQETTVLCRVRQKGRVSPLVSGRVTDPQTAKQTEKSHPTKTFFGASTVKGPYTIAVCRSDKKAWKKHGDWMRSTVIDSDNSCYLLLRRQYGNDPIVSLYKKSKVSSKNAYKIWSYPSARDLARLWCGSYSFLRKNKALPKRLRGIFSKVRHSPINAVIKRKTYSKPGWMDRQGINIYNDAGIVMSARGPYVIAVMTSLNGNDHRPVRELIRTLNKIQDTM